MMLGLGLILLLAPQWLDDPLVALALIATAVVATMIAAWLRRVLGDEAKPAA
jgi:hypothetical protein